MLYLGQNIRIKDEFGLIVDVTVVNVIPHPVYDNKTNITLRDAQKNMWIRDLDELEAEMRAMQ